MKEGRDKEREREESQVMAQKMTVLLSP
jgi:hypothetical protein